MTEAIKYGFYTVNPDYLEYRASGARCRDPPWNRRARAVMRGIQPRARLAYRRKAHIRGMGGGLGSVPGLDVGIGLGRL